MVIGIDASRANRTHKSGTEWYSYYIIHALAEIDHDNEYILYTDTPFTGGLAELVETHKNFKVKVLGWPWRFFWTQGRLSLEMLFRRPDVLFVPAHALPLIHPKKSVVTIHDIGFHREGRLYEEASIGAEGKRRQSVIDFLVRTLSLGRYGANSRDYLEWSTLFSLQHAKKTIAISHFTKDELIDAYQAPENKIVVVHNGYNSELYKALPKDAQSTAVISKYGLQHPYIFYVGRLEKKKNIATLIEAFYLLKQRHPELAHKLYLVGDASYGFDEIKNSIHGFGLQHDVRATGWVAENDLPYIYNEADAFVFPSNYEGFGIPLLQAMATNTPIAASKAASIPEIAGDAAVLFDPADPSDMANALFTVLSDQAKRQDLVIKGQERVKQFSWQRAATEILDLIRGL